MSRFKIWGISSDLQDMAYDVTSGEVEAPDWDPCRIPASGKPGRHSVRVHAEGLKAFGGGITAVDHAQVKFLYRVAHLVNRKNTGFGTADQPTRKFVCGKAEIFH